MPTADQVLKPAVVLGVQLLIIDELRFVPLSRTVASWPLELISQRYGRGSMPITSDLPFGD